MVLAGTALVNPSYKRGQIENKLYSPVSLPRLHSNCIKYQILISLILCFRSAVSYSEHRGTGCFTDLLAELSKLQDDVAEASEHELFELSMGLLILINVIIMALDHHGSSDYIDELITRANAVSI